MPPEAIQSTLANLRERLERLEEKATRTNRGRLNQQKAADYLGKSREFLRKAHLCGDGPRRGEDGSYAIDDLDRYAQGIRD